MELIFICLFTNPEVLGKATAIKIKDAVRWTVKHWKSGKMGGRTGINAKCKKKIEIDNKLCQSSIGITD